MQLSIKNFIITLLILGGCQSNEDNAPNRDILDISQLELFTPPNVLSKEFFYQDSFDDPSWTNHYYYDNKGKITIKVGLNASADTTGAVTYLYENDVLKWNYNYSFSHDNLVLESYSEYLYDGEGRLSKVLAHAPGETAEIRYENIYGQNGNLTQVWYSSDGAEKTTYEYNENGQRIKESVYAGQESPWIVYFYRYNDQDYLEAKETSYSVPAENEKKDAFQFDYDQSGNLIEKREYLPSYDFTLARRYTYEYY
ncbi:hypothetical protein FKX85_06530 [Echinicola soli]|uniref:YD repeat-containing protein n=1 Tax=Echinicola soli TaxID=2591634 RepID=A0A514CFX6_9BACT|nr:hypothetical protein [Echinicola soli]QDH78708.1 hypothetical protein FKX85_06530 [Echinicola soli]